jgi:hypothetical protein
MEEGPVVGGELPRVVLFGGCDGGIAEGDYFGKKVEGEIGKD